MPNDSQSYLDKKRSLQNILTIYGRKPVLEALSDLDVIPSKLHLANSNKSAGILDEIITLANARKTEINHHDKRSLSRISKNSKQDQGVALDIHCKKFISLDGFLELDLASYTLVALDQITNPQNLGMIIRAVCASNCNGILIPSKGTAKLDALVIKASAGTLFKAPIIRCEQLQPALVKLKEQQSPSIFGLDGKGKEDWKAVDEATRKVFLFGNESRGISAENKPICNELIRIPMQNDVESLNVAVAASLVVFRKAF